MERMIAFFDILAAQAMLICIVFIAVGCYTRWHNARAYKAGLRPPFYDRPIEIPAAILAVAVAVLFSRFLA
jgi:hypothetical protein